MTTLVDRLRQSSPERDSFFLLCTEAADEIERLREALGHAIKIIEDHVPIDALGTNSDGAEHLQRHWPLLEEYLHHMRAALKDAQ